MWNQAWWNDCRGNVDYTPARLQPTINIKCCIYFHSGLTDNQAMPCHPCAQAENNLPKKTRTAVGRPLLLDPAVLDDTNIRGSWCLSAASYHSSLPTKDHFRVSPSVWWNETDTPNSALSLWSALNGWVYPRSKKGRACTNNSAGRSQRRDKSPVKMTVKSWE